MKLHCPIKFRQHLRRKPRQYVTARLIPLLDYYQSRVPQKYREYKVTVFLSLLATSSIAVLSHLGAREGSETDYTAIAAVVSGCAGAITAWQSESGASRKINRYTNSVVALKNRAYLPVICMLYHNVFCELECQGFSRSAIRFNSACVCRQTLCGGTASLQSTRIRKRTSTHSSQW